MEQVYVIKTRKKLSLIMLISWSKARRIDKALCLFVTGCDCCNADAEHWRQQQRHVYVAYVPPHTPCPWFGMLAMFRAMAAEVWWVQFIVKISGVWGGACLHLRHHPIFFHQDFCTLLEWELSWGTKVMLRAFPESARNTLNLSLQQNTEFIVWGGWISILIIGIQLLGNSTYLPLAKVCSYAILVDSVDSLDSHHCWLISWAAEAHRILPRYR